MKIFRLILIKAILFYMLFSIMVSADDKRSSVMRVEGTLEKSTDEIVAVKDAGEVLKEIPITIISDPENADVFIDGKYMGSGRRFETTTGVHNLELKKEGFKTIQKEIEVSEAHTLFEYKMEKIELQTMTINSTPRDARIFIDGVEVGKTNKQLFYYPGEYKLSLAKSGYETNTDSIAIIAGADNIFDYTLTKTAAMLTIETTPDDAEIYLNGAIQKTNSPNVAPGKYEIEVKSVGYIPETRTVVVDKYNPRVETFTLRRKTGNLQLLIEPMETSVRLERDSAVIDSWTGSALKKDIPIGDYTIVFSADGYPVQRRPLSVPYEQTTTLNIDMNEARPADTIPERVEKPTEVSSSEMILVESGSYQMGSKMELPMHTVKLSSFYLGKYEVTQREWQEVMGNNPSQYRQENLPVESVSWFDAVEYCIKKSEAEGLTPCYQVGVGKISCDFSADGYRLPTEAEWEFAARGGNKSYAYKYSAGNNIDDVAWYDGNSQMQTHPVGQKKANELGICDMSGNVWEWCSDWYDRDYYSSSPIVDPHGPSSGRTRVLRGGDWSSGADLCRSTLRAGLDPNGKGPKVGFRICRGGR